MLPLVPPSGSSHEVHPVAAPGEGLLAWLPSVSRTPNPTDPLSRTSALLPQASVLNLVMANIDLIFFFTKVFAGDIK